MNTDNYVADLQSILEPAADPEYAVPMKKYMKDHFEYLGIKSPRRKELLREFFKDKGLPGEESMDAVIRKLWTLPYREYQYCAMTIGERTIKRVKSEFLKTIVFMITEKSWWDTVDLVAANLAGPFFKKFPEFVPEQTNKWCNSDNMWLNRSAILYQLKYKAETDTELLEKYILPHTASKEFFIKKAIGWSLREYSKTNEAWVRKFIDQHTLQPLSVREGLKWLNRGN